MIRIETQNKYVAGKRESEAYFLDTLHCVKYQFCKDMARKVAPTDKYELFCVTCGEVYIPDAKKRIGKNGLILIRKFSQTKLIFKDTAEIIHIVFSASYSIPLLNNRGEQMFFENFMNFSLINKLYRFSCRKNRIAGICDALLLELLFDMDDCSRASCSEIALYQQAYDWIGKNSARAITSQDVASAMGCSRAHLNRIIKNTCGENLSNAVARHRLERIKSLCDSVNISASEIASELDFYSTEQLCKFFRYHEGISINKYKRRIKQF